MARAAACYLVTYQQEFTKKILSFAWLFSLVVGQVATKELAETTARCEQNSIDRTNRQIFVSEKRIHSNFALVGQAFLHSLNILIEHKSLRFIVQFDPSVDEKSCILRLSNDQRTQKFIHLRVPLMEWAMLEVTTGWLDRQEVLSTKKYASRTAHRPTVNYYRTWKHVATQFLLAKYQPATCSALVLCQNRFLTKQSVTVTNDKGGDR